MSKQECPTPGCINGRVRLPWEKGYGVQWPSGLCENCHDGPSSQEKSPPMCECGCSSCGAPNLNVIHCNVHGSAEHILRTNALLIEAVEAAHECIVITAGVSRGSEKTDRDLIDKTILKLEAALKAALKANDK